MSPAAVGALRRSSGSRRRLLDGRSASSGSTSSSSSSSAVLSVGAAARAVLAVTLSSASAAAPEPSSLPAPRRPRPCASSMPGRRRPPSSPGCGRRSGRPCSSPPSWSRRPSSSEPSSARPSSRSRSSGEVRLARRTWQWRSSGRSPSSSWMRMPWRARNGLRLRRARVLVPARAGTARSGPGQIASRTRATPTTFRREHGPARRGGAGRSAEAFIGGPGPGGRHRRPGTPSPSKPCRDIINRAARRAAHPAQPGASRALVPPIVRQRRATSVGQRLPSGRPTTIRPDRGGGRRAVSP